MIKERKSHRHRLIELQRVNKSRKMREAEAYYEKIEEKGSLLDEDIAEASELVL